MKNSLYLASFTLAFLLSASGLKAQIVIDQSGNNFAVYSTLDSAITAAASGDYLYLSGGVFTVNGSSTTNLDKPLHFIGAGIEANSASVTNITRVLSTNGYFNIGSNASNSTFDGINFQVSYICFQDDDNTDDSASNVVFSRCIMESVSYNSVNSNNPFPKASATFHESIITGNLYAAGGNTSHFTGDRCFIENPVSSGPGAVFNNCIMDAYSFVGAVSNNCIFYASGSTPSALTLFNNCVFADPAPGTAIYNNCLVNVPMSTVFVNAATAPFAWTNDYHMASGSPAINYGTDGHDCGIYGTAIPAKAGFVPYNPHFTGAIVPTSTDVNNNLNVNITVAAQTY